MRRLTALTALVGVLVLASVASTASGARLIDRFHGTFSETFADNICGIDGTSVVNGMDNIQVFADGTFKDQFRVNQVFTSAATGKSILIFVAQQFVGAGPIDNGDGTVTFTEHMAGLVLRFKIPNGPVLKDADGKPILGAGVIDSVVTFDIATGDLISLQETVHGPHPVRDGVDICGPAIAYLTS